LAFGGGGNRVLDTTVFLEYLPSNKQYVLTLLATWWGIGQTFTGFMAWAFCECPSLIPRISNSNKALVPRYSYASIKTCNARITWDGDTSSQLAVALSLL
jgi:hypothetical protein